MGMLVNPYRRAGLSSPADISGLSFWFDVKDASTLWANAAGTTPASLGGGVARLSDKSGNGRHLSNGGASSAFPSYNGTTLFFDGGDTLGNSTNAPCATVIIAAQVNGGNPAFAGLLSTFSDFATNVDFVWVRNNSATSWYTVQGAGDGLANSTHFWNNQVQTNAYTLDTPRIYSADGTSHPGSLIFSNGFLLGTDRLIPGRGILAHVYGMVGYDTILSTANRNAVEAWMASRYGITI